MATFNKFQQFAEDLGLGVHNLHTGTLRVYLSNTAPNAATMAVKADLAEISAGNGYNANGEDIQNTYTESGGTGTLTGVDVVWTATGAVGPFRYVVLYNDTPTSPADPLIGWWDYGSSISLANGETFTTDFGASVLTVA
jgi:hypothetical protein